MWPASRLSVGHWVVWMHGGPSPAPAGVSPEMLYQTVWRTWLFIAYLDERWLYYQFSLPYWCVFSVNVGRTVLFELRSGRVRYFVGIDGSYLEQQTGLLPPHPCCPCCCRSMEQWPDFPPCHCYQSFPGSLNSRGFPCSLNSQGFQGFPDYPGFPGSPDFPCHWVGWGRPGSVGSAGAAGPSWGWVHSGRWLGPCSLPQQPGGCCW